MLNVNIHNRNCHFVIELYRTKARERSFTICGNFTVNSTMIEL